MKLFRKRNTRKIDFIIIGTQKAGTTALFRYLRGHPDIGVSKTKELRFFNNDDYFQNKKINYKPLENQFDFSSNKRVYGEATPAYLYWEPSCKRIWEYNKKIKLISILRNPIERAYSHWNMNYQNQVEKKPFSICIENERTRTRHSLPFQHKNWSYIDRGLYSEQIRRYKRFFSDEQMLFIKYDTFKNNQKVVLNQIFDFLDVDSNKIKYFPKTTHKRTYNQDLLNNDKEFLQSIFKYDIKEVERLLGWDCKEWLK